ncbi:MAG: xanthine dehydrogenase family protein subunit M [Anaerolineae bacterium]|nr:xanthine dehydrogenase family protein subunit M [Anaerolineae bacterium]
MIDPLQYFAPTTLQQASSLLVQWGPRARMLSGGTALLPALERAQWSATAIVNLKTIPGLRELEFDPSDGLHVGALVTLAELQRSPIVRAHYPVLQETIAYVATPQVRNLATLGGNLCVATPTADLAIILLALDARVTVHRVGGKDTLSLDRFYPTWGGTQLAQGEILTGISIPPPRGSARYQRFMVRQAVDVPLVNFAIALEQQEGQISHARIVLGGSGPRPLRMIRAERALLGQLAGRETFARAIDLVIADAYPPDDLRASRAYRHELLRVLLRRTFSTFTTTDRANASF